MRIRAALAAVLVLLSVGAACSSSKKAPKTSNSTTTVTPLNPTTTLGPSTTVKGKTTTTTAGAAKAKSAEAASSGLFDAWKAGDKAKARQFANDAAVTELFSHPYTGPSPTFQGCEPHSGPIICSYSYEGGGMQFTVTGNGADGFTVTKVSYTAD